MQDPPNGHLSDLPDRRPAPRRRARRIATGLGLVVLVGVAAYLTTRPLGGPATGGPAALASVDARGTAGQGFGIGQAAPDFVSADAARKPLLVDLDGHPIRLADFAGKPVWIVFWATWCTPCQQEASDILALYHAHKGDGLVVLAIDVQEPAAAVRDYVRNHDLDYEIGLDPTADVQALYGGWGLPSHYFLTGKGVIADRYLGQMTADVMEQHLRAIIGS